MKGQQKHGKAAMQCCCTLCGAILILDLAPYGITRLDTPSVRVCKVNTTSFTWTFAFVDFSFTGKDLLGICENLEGYVKTLECSVNMLEIYVEMLD
jgi:hypothetical protein